MKRIDCEFIYESVLNRGHNSFTWEALYKQYAEERGFNCVSVGSAFGIFIKKISKRIGLSRRSTCALLYAGFDVRSPFVKTPLREAIKNGLTLGHLRNLGKPGVAEIKKWITNDR